MANLLELDLDCGWGKRIAAPTDLTCDDRKAIDYAVAFASRFRAELVLLHVYEAEGGVDSE